MKVESKAASAGSNGLRSHHVTVQHKCYRSIMEPQLKGYPFWPKFLLVSVPQKAGSGPKEYVGLTVLQNVPGWLFPTRSHLLPATVCGAVVTCCLSLIHLDVKLHWIQVHRLHSVLQAATTTDDCELIHILFQYLMTKRFHVLSCTKLQTMKVTYIEVQRIDPSFFDSAVTTWPDLCIPQFQQIFNYLRSYVMCLKLNHFCQNW